MCNSVHDGPLDAPLVIVGDSPKWQSVRDGRPFAGAEGHLLNQALKDAGLRREDVLVTNLVEQRPLGDEWDRHVGDVVADGFRVLDSLLRLHPRALVVGAGSQAFLACATGAAAPARERDVVRELERHYLGTVSELRGYVFPGAYGPTMPIMHPAAVLKQWLPWRATTTWDLRKAVRLGASQQHPRRQRSSRYVINAAQAAAEVAALIRAPLLAVDSEEPPSACVAFAASVEEGVTFPLETCWEAVAEILAAPTRKVLQNAQYDLTRFRRLGFQVGGVTEDTMLLWHATEPLIAGKADSGAKQTQKGLRFLASVFTDEPWWKNYSFADETEKWTLCATDARVTLEVWEALCR